MNVAFFALASLVAVAATSSLTAAAAESVVLTPESGGLDAFDAEGRPLGPCALRHTAIDVEISFPFARVDVTQTFHNPFPEKIEAVYTFPLGAASAVVRMEMIVGDRVVRGEVRERGAAREEYEAARRDGHVASLLDQERPNVFTQHVAHIEPGTEVMVRIGTIETLETADGVTRFHFPMVVAPRYVPGGRASGGESGAVAVAVDAAVDADGFAAATRVVPDAPRVTPIPAPPDTRAGHDVSLRVRVDSGGPGLAEIASALHEMTVTEEVRGTDGRPRSIAMELARKTAIPNRDFVLTFRLAEEGIRECLFTHASPERGERFVTLVLAPPERVDVLDAMPRELVFVVDTSGSMIGAPLRAAKEIVATAIGALRPDDTFDLVTFSGATRLLWPAARPATEENRAAAQAFLESADGGGGTEMMAAIRAALAPEAAPRRVRRGRHAASVVEPGAGAAAATFEIAPMRIVAFLTDGCVGNDLEIIGAVESHAAATRVFSFGIGSSVNTFLIEGLARAGRGAAEIVLPGESASEKVERFTRRIATPVLADVSVEYSPGIEPVTDVVPDLFDFRPLVLHARAATAGRSAVTIRGTTPLGPYERTIDFDVPESEPRHDVIAALWAREKVERLLWRDWKGAQRGFYPEELRAEIVRLGETYRIATPFTSFVAVDRDSITFGGDAVRAPVAVERPAGAFGARRAGFGKRGIGRAPSDPTPPARGSTAGSPTARRGSAMEGYERWEFYWEYERDAFLATPARSAPEPAARDAAIAALSRAMSDRAAPVRAAAALALGRSRAPGAATALTALLDDPQPIVAERAAVALGLLGRADSAPVLLDVLAGTHGRVAPRARTRAFAAAALALLPGPPRVEPLAAALRGGEREVAAVAAVALGATRSAQAAPHLAAVAFDPTRNALVRAHALAALARTGDSGVEAMLRGALRDPVLDVSRAAALAIGGLPAPVADATLAALLETMEKSPDVQSKNWAILAIGRAGGATARECLLRGIEREVQSTQACGAIALALHGRRFPLDAAAQDALRKGFDDARDPSVRAAFAIALGCASDVASAERIRTLLLSPTLPRLRGAAAEALALLRDAASAPDLLRLLSDPGVRHRAELEEPIRRALAALSCRDATAHFADAVLRGDAGAATALGTLGDPAALPRLAAIAGAHALSSDAARARAIAAIGMILAENPLLLRRAFAPGVDYRAMVPALEALLELE